MNAATERVLIVGAAGAIECALDIPSVPSVGLAVLAHPHPLFGGTLDNKVVQTLARAFVQLGFTVVRPNFRGVGASAGVHDEGVGEALDLQQVAEHFRALHPGRLLLAGFSFGGAVASKAAPKLHGLERLVLIAPATRFGLEAVSADTLVIHGEQDDVVPLAAVMDWARPQALPIIVVPAGGHFFHGQLPLLKALVLRNFGISDA